MWLNQAEAAGEARVSNIKEIIVRLEKRRWERTGYPEV